MGIREWLFLTATGLCTVPLQAALIYTLISTFREPAQGEEQALHGMRPPAFLSRDPGEPLADKVYCPEVEVA